MKKNLTLDKHNDFNITTKLKIDNLGKETAINNIRELTKMPT